MTKWCVYVLQCRDGSLYTGITTDLARRLRKHNAGAGGAYTRAKRPVRLMFQEAHPTRSAALIREHQIKRWPRAKKLGLLARTTRRSGGLGVVSSRAVETGRG